MKRARKTDREKLEACLEAALMVIADDDVALKDVTAKLQANLGLGWTLMAALQWLTGKAAWREAEAIRDGGSIGQCAKELAQEVVRFAADVCKDVGASGGAEAALQRLRHARRGGSLH